MNTNDEHEYSRIADLISKQISGEISPVEQAELDGWLQDNPAGQAIYSRLTDEAQRHEAMRRMGRFDEETAWAHFEEKIQGENIIVPLRRRRFIRYASAAAVIAGLTVGGYFVIHQKQRVQTAQNQPHDIAPGHNQATLTLANGKKIVLTKNLKGTLAVQGNTTIHVNRNTSIAYTAANTTTAVQYNTLSTAKGEMSPYPLVLADGTKIWLNAASSITFPTAFPGKERIVTVTGEAIFEVAHNAARPFKINVAGQTIEDIGTEFNVNAYADEPNVKVTLASGKVKIVKDGKEALLNPGQMAITTADNIKVADADLDAAFAWKNGLFLYDNEPLSSIMRQVARWYDVDVVYDGANPNKLFGGGVSRYKNVSQVLRKLELTGEVHFSIEGRRIIARK